MNPRFWVVLALLVLVCGVAFAANEFEVTAGANDPGSHEWRPVDDTSYDVFAQWKLKNTTVRELQIDKITIFGSGAGNDTSLEVLVYSDNDEDGLVDTPGDTYRGWAQYNVNDGNAVVSIGNNLKVASGASTHLIFSAHTIAGVNAGDTFKTYFGKIEGHYTVNDVKISQDLVGKSYFGGTVTISKTYYVELLAGTGNASWVATNDAVSGKAMINGEAQEFDFTLKVFKNCAEWLSSTGESGGQYTILNAAPMQYFNSTSEDFTSAAVMMRSSGSPGADTVHINIRQDSPTGTIIKEATRQISFSQVNTWYSFNFSDCAPVCGNNHTEAGEECDSTDLGKTCKDFEGLYNGTLSCNANCTYNKTACLSLEQQLKAECAGAGMQGTSIDCSALNENYGTNYLSGTITFAADCTPNLSNCSSQAPPAEPPPQEAVCGNNILEGNEACDSSKLNGKSCSSFGFDSGTLVCTNQCIFDIASCTYDQSGSENAVCGNGIRDGGERCDGADMGSYTCAGLGYASGTATCDSSCNPDLSKCVAFTSQGEEPAGELCGNAILDLGEQCDGRTLNNNSCQTMGYLTGILRCKNNCNFDVSDCSNEVTAYSGNTYPGTEPSPDASTMLNWGLENFDWQGTLYALVAVLGSAAIVVILVFVYLKYYKGKPKGKKK